MAHKERNAPLLVAGSLLVLAGFATIVTFIMLAGRFPPMGILWLPLAEIVAGVLLILVRNHLIVWLSLLCIIGAICMHGYYLKRIYDMAQFRSHTSADRDPETRRILSKMSTITSTRTMLNYATIGAELVALGLVQRP
ncbi:hypothetical protein ACFL2F_01110 [Myxococcota bacterium]